MAMSNLPLVTIGIPIWNGEKFIEETLNSLLNQTYRNIEIILLDNLSSDATNEICKRYSINDTRVKYILDYKNRDVCSAHKKTAELANGDYFLVACDDDVYHQNYIYELYSMMSQNPEFSLVYSNWDWIDEIGNIYSSNYKEVINSSDSCFESFIKYYNKRNPIPVVFGLIRTDKHRDALQFYKRPDNNGWNHDNLYMLRFISKNKVSYLNKKLFYYRKRDRQELYKIRNQNYGYDNSLFKIYIKRAKHEIAFSNVANNIINIGNFTKVQKYFLKIYLLIKLFITIVDIKFMLTMFIKKHLKSKNSK